MPGDVGATNPAQIAWLNWMAAHHVTWLRSLSCTAQPQRSNSFTHNWSGYIISNVGVGASTSMGWTVPSTSDVTGADSSIWAGQGGFNNNGDLPQAGTEQDRTSTGTTLYPWWEIFPDNNIQKINNFPIHSGETMSEIINTDVDRSVSFNICDTVTSQCVYITKTALKAIGPSVEWVAGRPTVGGRFTKLANFGTATIFNASSTLIKNYYPNNGSPYDMRSCNGATVLATPGSYNATTQTFNVYWRSAGLVEHC